MVKQISQSSEFHNFISSGSLVVVCFSATWCGPCRMIAPFFDQLAARYPDVVFLKVYEHECQELVHSERISAFPTFRFYKNRSQLDELRGANPSELESKLQHWVQKTRTFDSPGYSLSTTPQQVLSPQEAREARLKALSQETNVTKVAPTPTPQQNQNTNKPSNNYQSSSVYQQLKEMGFTDIQAYSALNSGANDIESAVTWLAENEVSETNIVSNDVHQQQESVKQLDQKTETTPCDSETNVVGSAKSFLCLDCQKLFRDNVSVEMHANKTGHSNFEESTTEIKPMTEEERKQKIQELQEKAALKRREREEQEKREELEREKLRRQDGKGTQQIREEFEVLERRRQAEQIRKEKEQSKLEKQRLLAELEKDKAERRARGGKLPSVLDIEGYNPNVIQMPSSSTNIVPTHSQQTNHPNPTVSPIEAIQNSIKALKNYKVGGDGGKALRILYTYTNNLIEHPEDPKFHSINLENQAYRTKVAPFIGGSTYLKTIGFVKNEQNTRFEINPNAIDFSLLHTARSLVEQGIAEYEQGI